MRQIALGGVIVESEDEFDTVDVSASEPWDSFVATAVAHGWAGIECLSGIPGSTGATPIQNVGAYGQDVSETIIRVEVLDRESGVVSTLTNQECRFGYRSSVFKNDERDRYVVLNVTFRLPAGGSAGVLYPELRRYLEERGESDQDLRPARDPAVALQLLMVRRARVAYIYVDVHHGDGVEGIFYDDPDVLTISLHESGRHLFPGTGFPDDAGVGPGRGAAANLPFEPFTWDEPWLEAFDRVVPALLRRFKPTILVTQDGCDKH